MNIRINKYLQMRRANWIIWINNPPTASHMGGVWKRKIRAVKARNYIYNSLVRGALKTFFKLHGKSLDDKV